MCRSEDQRNNTGTMKARKLKNTEIIKNSNINLVREKKKKKAFFSLNLLMWEKHICPYLTNLQNESNKQNLNSFNRVLVHEWYLYLHNQSFLKQQETTTVLSLRVHSNG